MGWFNNGVLLKGTSSCSAPHPLLFPTCAFQEQFSTSGLHYSCTKGAQAGHETIPSSEEECAGVGFMQKGQLRVEANTAAVPKWERFRSWTCKVLRLAAGTARSDAVPQKASCQRGGTQHFKTIYKYLTYFLWIAQ